MALEKLGFDWDPVTTTLNCWYEQLEEFYKQHHHVCVLYIKKNTTTSDDDHCNHDIIALGKWVKQQQEQYQRHQEGKSS